MAEQFYISNTIEKLSEKFAQNGQRKSDIFQKKTIITQTKGMNMWLAAELASKNNVFANFSFISPQNFINKLFKIYEVATNYDYAAGKLTWKIYSLLNEPEFMDKFGFVANYYQNDDVKRFQLAAKIADLFDQYMIYRSSIIEHWNQQQHSELDNKEFQSDFKKHEAWQFWLWQKIKQLNAEDSPDQVELLESLVQKLRDGDYNSQIKQEFPSISFFGVTVLTAFHYKVFQILHSIIDVNYYLVSPSVRPDWWQPNFRDRNDILANCKATGQYTFDTLLKNASADSITFDVTGKENKTLLNALQLDIAQNSTKNIQKLHFDPIKDYSLQIASTYSPVREVEALYNYLLDLLDRDKQLTVKDISVQLTDVELYAPYIKAVFDNGPLERLYTICDAAYTDGDTITNALESFFRIEIENFSNESVMRLLESKYVQRKFDLDDPDALRHLLNDANIRLGLEGRKEDDTYLQSWNHGLTKLILGYAIKGGPEYEWDGRTYFLTDNAEEREAYHIFRLSRLIKTLTKLHDEIRKDKPLNEWKDFLAKELMPQLFETTDDDAEEETYIQQQISSLSFHAHNDEKIPFSVIKQAVMDSLNAETRNSNYISGQLTFSSLLPVRSIPYKVIAVLGLNNDTFPRKQQPSGFDLLNFEPQPGDRNIRDNDKYLFLEILLAARQQLYLSYNGFSAKDNTELNPSLLIEELEEYLSIHPDNITEQILVKHPLHGFNHKYFGDNPRLFTYINYAGNEPAVKKETTRGNDPGETSKVIHFNDFVRFFKQPVKWYYNKTLGIYYNDEEESLTEHEVFEPDNLQKWKLKFDLLQMPDDKKPDYIRKNKSRGALPLGNMADVHLEWSAAEIEDLKESYLEKIKGYEEESEDFELQLGEYTLWGNIDQLFGDFHVFVNVSKDESQPKYEQEARLRHLVLSAMGNPRMTIFMSMKKPEEIAKMQILQKEAKKILEALCGFMELGSRNVIAYSPKSAKSYMEGDTNKAIDCLKEEAKYDPYLSMEIENGLFDDLKMFNSADPQQISELIFGSFTTESNA